MIFKDKIALVLSDPILLTLILGPWLLYIFTVLSNALIFMIRMMIANVGKTKTPEKPKKFVINETIKKENAKVVDTIDCGEIESVATFKDGKLVMCRCWKSQNFPYCDGSHNAHNKDTGDNIGPLIVKK